MNLDLHVTYGASLIALCIRHLQLISGDWGSVELEA